MLALLRGPGVLEWEQEIGEPGPDGMVFIRVVPGGTLIPYRATRFHTDDDLPVFEYAM